MNKFYSNLDRSAINIDISFLPPARSLVRSLFCGKCITILANKKDIVCVCVCVSFLLHAAKHPSPLLLLFLFLPLQFELGGNPETSGSIKSCTSTSYGGNLKALEG